MKSWYVTLALPLLFLTGIVDVVNWGASNGILVVSDASGVRFWNVYYNQIFSHAAICLLTGLLMCIATGYLYGMNRIYAQQKRVEQYDAKLAYYKMQGEQYALFERLRHDMKNHVLALHGLWKNSEFEKAGAYLERMREQGSLDACDEATGSRAIDALLHEKKERARRQGVRLACDVRIPKNCGIDEFDLCVLFGNALDNALNGCMAVADEARRFVEIEAHAVKSCFLLVVKNAAALQGRKEVKAGTGLANIGDAVKKYDGTFDLKVTDHVFELSVLLPMCATDMTGNGPFDTGS